ncbi:DUF4279 domain-containing protein [Streptomyces hainanensis]|uniref:DUF4279 domain-containing protein n=1 Tax=Streptomyces hainanensis TaxID=402648 RepID=UPI001404BEE6|nr:DUF4279 domain-containing protein [Streptomyces hainanensis]
MARSPKQWQSLSLALLITKADLSPDELTRRLGTEPDIARAPGEEQAFREGAGCWILTATASDVAGLLDALSPRVAPLASELAALREEGYRVQLDISGHIDSGMHHLTISPDLIAELARLGLPLSFTTRSSKVGSDEDLMGWDPPTYSHRRDS